MSEDEANRRAHAAVLAQKYPVILDMLLEGSIHLTSLRIIGKCLTPKNHKQVLEAARAKNKTELEHLAAALCPKPDVPTVLRKLPGPRLDHDEAQSEESLFASGVPVAELPGQAPEIAGAEPTTTRGDGQPLHANQPTEGLAPVHVALPLPTKSRMAPLSPERYNLQVTIDRETYEGLVQLQELSRHQVRNGDLARIIKDSVLGRLEHVKRGKFGKTKRPRKSREQESWIKAEKTEAEANPAEKEPVASAAKRGPSANVEAPASSAVIALGRLQVNSRHIPAAVKREVWERDRGRCAFVSRSGRRCSEKRWLEFHHIHAYALGGPATVDNIALRCRTHNAHEGVVLFGKKFIRPGAKADSVVEGRGRDEGAVSIRPGANGSGTAHGTSAGES